MTWQDLIGTQVDGRYTLHTLLYAGRHHSEFAATASDDGERPVSIALVEPEPGEAGQELAAIHRARQLRHPNILHILDAGQCIVEGVPVLFIATEAAQGTLAEALAAGPVPATLALLEDILAALEWLHAQGLVYRNLEPDTIVRVDGRWKLADLSQLHSSGEFGPSQAAGRSVPPEAASGSILPAWDVWALGVLLQDAYADRRGILPAPFDAIVSGCLESDPGRRLTLQKIRKLLEPKPEPIRAALPNPPAALIPEPHRISEAFQEEPTPSRSRMVFVIAAAIVILSVVLAFAYLRRDRSPTATPAVPAVNRPAATPVQTAPVPVMAPTVAPTPAPPGPVKPTLGKPALAKPALAKPTPAPPAQQTGRADYFADGLEGHQTASGELFSNHAMTAANRGFPIGTRLRVTNLQNGRRVVVRVNDRGPHRRGFIISVTRHAAEQLGFVKAGSARVKLEVVK